MSCYTHIYYAKCRTWKKDVELMQTCNVSTTSSTMTTVLRMFRFRARSHSNWTLSTLFWPIPSNAKDSSDIDQHYPMLLLPPVWPVKWVENLTRKYYGTFLNNWRSLASLKSPSPFPIVASTSLPPNLKSENTILSQMVLTMQLNYCGSHYSSSNHINWSCNHWTATREGIMGYLVLQDKSWRHSIPMAHQF